MECGWGRPSGKNLGNVLASKWCPYEEKRARKMKGVVQLGEVVMEE